MPASELLRRGELQLMNANQLLAHMNSLNPFGGYSLPVKPEQRKIMIETIMRYEGYKPIDKSNTD